MTTDNQTAQEAWVRVQTLIAELTPGLIKLLPLVEQARAYAVRLAYVESDPHLEANQTTMGGGGGGRAVARRATSKGNGRNSRNSTGKNSNGTNRRTATTASGTMTALKSIAKRAASIKPQTELPLITSYWGDAACRTALAEDQQDRRDQDRRSRAYEYADSFLSGSPAVEGLGQ